MELCVGLGGTEGMGCPRTYSCCVVGAPSGGSHHFLPLWEHERTTPPHLTFISFISDPLRPRDKVLFPSPTSMLGKFPCGLLRTPATLGGWGRGVSPPGRKLSCADHKPTQDAGNRIPEGGVRMAPVCHCGLASAPPMPATAATTKR